jgi:hypothetical protein
MNIFKILLGIAQIYESNDRTTEYAFFSCRAFHSFVGWFRSVLILLLSSSFLPRSSSSTLSRRLHHHRKWNAFSFPFSFCTIFSCCLRVCAPLTGCMRSNWFPSFYPFPLNYGLIGKLVYWFIVSMPETYEHDPYIICTLYNKIVCVISFMLQNSKMLKGFL